MDRRGIPEVDAEGLEMRFAAIDFFVLRCPALIAFKGAFRLPDEIELFILFDHHCPVGIVIAERRGDPEPAGGYLIFFGPDILCIASFF